MLLSLVVLGAGRTARLLGEDKASDADLSTVQSIDLGMLQKLTEFPSCIASCAFGAPLWLRLTAVRGCMASTRVGCRILLSILYQAESTALFRSNLVRDQCTGTCVTEDKLTASA